MLACLSFAGIGLSLASAQQIADDGSSAVIGYELTEDIEVGDTPFPADPGLDPIKPVAEEGISEAAGGSPKSRVVPPAAKSVVRPPHSMYARFEAETQRRTDTYVGTRIDPHSSPKSGHDELTQEIVAAFAKLDTKVQERAAHSAWVDKYPAANPVGCAGRISNLERVAGGWLVEIQLASIFSPRAGQMVTTDKCLERWLYNNGTLQQVSNPDSHSPIAEGLIVDYLIFNFETGPPLRSRPLPSPGPWEYLGPDSVLRFFRVPE